MFGLPRPQLIGVDRVGKGASGLRIRNDHGLVVTENFCRLGHEMDTAKDDRGRFDGGRYSRQSERVTDMIGHVLNLGHLIVVREYHRIALLGQTLDFGDPTVIGSYRTGDVGACAHTIMLRAYVGARLSWRRDFALHHNLWIEPQICYRIGQRSARRAGIADDLIG